MCSYIAIAILMSTTFPVREGKATCYVHVTGLVHVVLESVLNFNFSESLHRHSVRAAIMYTYISI